MGFNKRYFNIEMLIRHYKEDPEKCIENAIGKTDCMIFKDEISSSIIETWFVNKTEAIKILKEYVFRIIT